MKKSNYSLFIFWPLLITSILMTLSISSWFTMWMLIEINLMSFMPIMFNQLNFLNSNLMMKYYVIQTLASISMLMSFNSFYLLNFSTLKNLMYLSMFMKMGLPPFHFWFINLMKKNPWMICMTLSTLQKIIPILILIFMTFSKMLLTMLLLSIYYMILIIFTKYLNSMNLKIIMSYSSINNSIWLIFLSIFNKFIPLIYMMIYMIFLTFLMNLFKLYKFNNLNEMTSNKFLKINMMITMQMIILSSIPPSLMFMNKVILINLNINNYFALTSLILLSSMSIIIYFRLFFNFMLNNIYINKINLMNLIMMKSLYNKINLWMLMNLMMNMNMFMMMMFLIMIIN